MYSIQCMYVYIYIYIYIWRETCCIHTMIHTHTYVFSPYPKNKSKFVDGHWVQSLCHQQKVKLQPPQKHWALEKHAMPSARTGAAHLLLNAFVQREMRAEMRRTREEQPDWPPVLVSERSLMTHSWRHQLQQNHICEASPARV